LPRSFAIVTTCKGRLAHLKLALPRMAAQADELIVVDYSCPQRTGDYVRGNFPSAEVVSVAGETYFSNWKARNAGASAATADVLVFVDADTVLSENAIAALSEQLPDPAYGFIPAPNAQSFNTSGRPLAMNQLSGFLAVPAAEFRRVGGYDEMFEGYASGADVDLRTRLNLAGLTAFALQPSLVEKVIEHDAASRVQNHDMPIATSYAAGLLYRKAKRAILKIKGALELDPDERRALYAAAMRAAAEGGDRLAIDIVIGQQPILMPRQLGYERGTETLSLHAELSLTGKLPRR
jgi:glycosyltransferase involved in cell wall biosynthesis